MVIVLGALQEALAAFSNPMEALKMVFGVRSIRVFSKFSLDPYYEPLPWFMIHSHAEKLLPLQDYVPHDHAKTFGSYNNFTACTSYGSVSY